MTIKQNIAEIEYHNPNESNILITIQKNIDELTKSEKNPAKSNVENLKPAKIKPDYLKHIIAVNGLQFAFKRASIWYEYEFKELIGLRIPLYFKWADDKSGYYPFIIALGINPKFYFNRHKIIKGYAGSEIILGYQFTKTTGKNDIFYLDALANTGVSINPIKNLNITVGFGLGLGFSLDTGTKLFSDKILFSYYPEISIGYNF